MKTVKNILILLALLSTTVILSPSLSSSEEKSTLIKSQLVETSAKILGEKNKIELVWMKVLTMESEGRVKKHLSGEMLDAIESVVEKLSSIMTLLEYEAESIMAVPHIMDEYRSGFAKLRIKRVAAAREQIIISQQYLSWVYGESPYKSTLNAVGNPIINIQTALEFLEKAQLLLTPESEKQSKK